MCMWRHWFGAPQQFRKKKKVATLRTRGQHRLFPLCERKVMIWGEHYGGWTRCSWQRNAGGVGATVAAAEKGHLLSEAGAATDCLGGLGKGASKPHTVTLKTLADHDLRYLWPRQQESMARRAVEHHHSHFSQKKVTFCDQSQDPAVPQTVPGMTMFSGHRLILNPTDEMEQCSRPCPGPA